MNNNKLFDVDKLSDEKKKKIAKGALKYVDIMESYNVPTMLQENDIFKKWFTEFYGLSGSFKTPAMQVIFYELFQAMKELYANSAKSSKPCLVNVYRNISTIISRVVGRTEKSFPSKILHTFDVGSPIIDNNVLTGLCISKSIKTVDDAVDVYKELYKKYYDDNTIAIKDDTSYTAPLQEKGLIGIARQDDWYSEFKDLCGNEINNSLTSKDVKNILKDVCKAVKFKGVTNKGKQLELESQLELELKIEGLFTKTKSKDLLQEIKRQLKVDIIGLINGISEVKKIDFYLWALFSK